MTQIKCMKKRCFFNNCGNCSNKEITIDEFGRCQCFWISRVNAAIGDEEKIGELH